ncbi:MAG TPA: hypothetical protein VKB12_19710 [Pyrinomonadaceae bacterium]|nr:hypothetical protein [Pyrinomonadaceae bacterium]
MFGSSILEVAIGMVFVYLLMSLICSAANEIIESFLKNRATDLERGLREMFNQEGGGRLAQLFYNHPMINGLFQGKYRRAADKAIGRLDYLRPTNLPTYIPARNFSYAVLDLLLHPPAEASVPRDDAAAGVGAAAVAPVNVSPLPISMDAVRTAITRNLSRTEAGRALRTLAEQSGEDIDALRENMEAWFNGAMDRVSGHYKRRTKWIIFTLGFALTAFLNVNTITVANRLSSDNTLRSVIVARAEAFAHRADAQQQQAAGGGQANARDGETARKDFDANRAELEGLGLPIGWPGGFHFVWPWSDGFKGYENLWGPLIGWLLTAGAISMGAPFWFDILNKIMVVRSTVKPHEKSPEEDSEDRQKPDAKTSVVVAGGGLGVAPAQPVAGGGGVGAVPASEPVQTPEPEVAAAPQAEDNESDVDGCDVDFSAEEATTDEELPPTKGGVG